MTVDVAAARQAGEAWPRFPYPGLRPFRITADADESLIFFGRTANKDDVLERLDASQFVSVVGPSGCGKSSLVRVGVIPALEAGFLTRAGYDWITGKMLPGDDPLGNLAKAFAGVCAPAQGMAVDDIAALLRDEPSGLWLLMDRLAPRLAAAGASARPRRLLLLLDQFEEIFSGAQQSPAVDQFIRLITWFFRQPHPDLYLVLTMRTDFIEQCANFPGLAEILNKTQYITPVLRGADLRDAIVRPAEAYGGELEPALVERIRRDVGAGSSYDADHLPLMQHALLWLWQQAWRRSGAAEPPVPGRDGPQTRAKLLLTLADYETQGGIRGILNEHADEIYAGLGERPARIAEAMFRRLSERDASRRYKRAPAPMSEVCALAHCAPEELRAVLAAFIEASFVEERPENNPADPRLDVSHESLIRQWKRLKDWADAEAEKLRNFREIAGDAETWQGQGRSPAFLKTGGQFEVEQDWWRDHRPTAAWAGRYPGIEGIFPLVEQYRAAGEELRAAAERDRAAARNARRTARRRKFAVIGAAIAALVIVVFLYQRIRLEAEAENQRIRLEAEADRQRAIAETANASHLNAAVLLGRRDLARGRASAPLLVSRAFLDDRKDYAQLPEIETLAHDALAQLRELRVIPVQSPLFGVDSSQDGRWLVTVSSSMLCFWDTRKWEDANNDDRGSSCDLSLPGSYFGARLNVQGDRLLLSDQNNAVLLKHLDLSGPMPRLDEENAIPLGRGVGVFSGDGKRVATGGRSQPFSIWDAQTGKLLAWQQPGSEPSNSWFLALNADGSRLALTNGKGGIDIYHVEGGASDNPDVLSRSDLSRSQATGQEDFTRGLTFHPTERNLLLVAHNRDALAVDVATRAKTWVGDHPQTVYQAVFSADGTLVATATADGVVRVWRYPPDAAAAGHAYPVATFGEHDGTVFAVRFRPDGRQIASGGRDQTLRIWTIAPALAADAIPAERGALSAFIGAHLPAGDRDPDALRFEFCLLGLKPAAECLSNKPPPG